MFSSKKYFFGGVNHSNTEEQTPMKRSSTKIDAEQYRTSKRLRSTDLYCFNGITVPRSFIACAPTGCKHVFITREWIVAYEPHTNCILFAKAMIESESDANEQSGFVIDRHVFTQISQSAQNSCDCNVVIDAKVCRGKIYDLILKLEWQKNGSDDGPVCKHVSTLNAITDKDKQVLRTIENLQAPNYVIDLRSKDFKEWIQRASTLKPTFWCVKIDESSHTEEKTNEPKVVVRVIRITLTARRENSDSKESISWTHITRIHNSDDDTIVYCNDISNHHAMELSTKQKIKMVWNKKLFTGIGDVPIQFVVNSDLMVIRQNIHGNFVSMICKGI